MSDLKAKLFKNSDNILTTAGVIGVPSTAFLAVKDTERCKRYLAEKGICKENWKEDKKTTFLMILKAYWPSVTTGAVTVASIIASNRISNKKYAALASAYTLATTAFSEYKDSVKEVVGEKKAKQINDDAAKKAIEVNPPRDDQFINTGHGNTRCLDKITGRYFYSSMEYIKSVQNDLNEELLSKGYKALNDFYYELGLPEVKIGNSLGWDINVGGQLKVDFSSCLDTNGIPCLVINYDLDPLC